MFELPSTRCPMRRHTSGEKSQQAQKVLSQPTTTVVLFANQYCLDHRRAEFLHSIESRIQRMESLLHSTIPAHQETLQAQDRKPQPAKSPEPLPIEKELDNLVINETGAQKYIGMHCAMI